MNRMFTKDTKVIYSVRSDKDAHFTGAIVQNATEEENFVGLISNRIRIVGVTIQSDQELDYRLIFFNTDAFANSDLDVDDLVGEVELDIPKYGFRIAGAGQYYMSVHGLSLDYEDKNGSYELHIALQDLSAVSKNAGATGEVVVIISYQMRN